MKTSKKDILSFCKQLISSVLSVTLLINLATPLAAQSVASDTGTKQVEMQQRFTKALEREVLQAARESTLTDSGTLAKRYFSDPDIRRLEELELAFNHPTLDPNSETKDMKADFVNQYNRVIEEEIITARQKVKQYERALRKQKEALRKEAIEAKVSDAVLNAWDKEAESKIQENIATLQTKITAWAVQARAEADSQYEAMLKEAQNESQKILRADLEELFALYKRVPYKALPYLINISITILLADGRNTSLLTQAEKDELLKLYIKEVQENTSCYKGKETWGRPCQGALNAVTGLGILGDANDARYISEFIDKVMTSPAAARGLLVGVSALLAMKQYKAVRRLLQTATQQESDTSHVDILSVKNLVDNIAATKGKYLGEVSKWAQFPAPGVGNTTDMSSSNAWEEIAYMLGDEGSAESLAILRDYGINKCSGYENKTLKGNTEYKIACGGIKPFLVGALV
ncbi:MAG: hypothetical protein J6U96_05015, partial [Elusimicrobiaceae bacterium]|nr:hypothetical protein [Elusimicrobiaceae bacterium]